MKPKTETRAVPLTVIGIDIGKDVFHGLGGIGDDDATPRFLFLTDAPGQHAVMQWAETHPAPGGLYRRAALALIRPEC